MPRVLTNGEIKIGALSPCEYGEAQKDDNTVFQTERELQFALKKETVSTFAGISQVRTMQIF